jgi:hypothetical protein
MDRAKTLTARQRLAHLAALWCRARPRHRQHASTCFAALRAMLFPPPGEPPMTPAAAARAAGATRAATTRWKARFLADMHAAAALSGVSPADLRADLARRATTPKPHDF